MFKFLVIFATLFFIQSSVSQLKLHGGPVMDKPISLHFLYYGPWGAKDEEVVVLDFVGRNIDSSSWFAISRCMEDIAGNPITDQIDVPTTFFNKNTKKFGNVIDTKDQLETLLKSTISDAGLNLDPNDIYVLIAHDDVSSALACKEACGFHSYFNNSDRTPIKYMLVGAGGISNKCPECELNINGPWGPLTNQLVNTFAHYLVNTVSDPVPFTGWYDPNVVEAASKCTGNFLGAIPFLPNKAKNWNVVISSSTEKHWFLLQANWDIISNSCRLYPISDCKFVAPPTPLVSTAHNPSSANMLKAGFSLLVSSLIAVAFLF